MQISGQRKKKEKKSGLGANVAKGMGMGGIGQRSVPDLGGGGGSSSSASLPGKKADVIEFKSRAGTVEKVCPGCVVIRGIMPLEVQQKMLTACFDLGRPLDGTPTDEHHQGFFEPPQHDGGRLQLNQGNRGRIIHDVNAFPAFVTDACLQYVSLAREADGTIPPMNPTTVLVNFYNQKGTFKWHRDTEDPSLVRAGTGKPIVSLTIGEACDFGIKQEYEDEAHTTVRLESGDVIIFGGPARMIVHSVLAIHPNTRPPLLKFPFQPGRLNLTFREVDGVIDTSMFPAYRVKYDIEES